MTTSGGFALATLATVSIACNYATRSLIPIVSHAVCSEGMDCTAAELVSDSTSAFFVGDLLAQFTAGALVRLVAGPWLLALSTAGWALATILIPMALKSSSPQQAHSLLQGFRGLLCGIGYPSAHAVVAATPKEIRATVLGLINAAAGIGSMLANVCVPGLLSQNSWELSFNVLGVLSLVAAAALVLLSLRSRVGLFTQPVTRRVASGEQPPKSSPKEGSVGRDILRWLQEPLIRGIIVWMVVVSVGGQAIGGAFLPTFFIERHGLSVATLGVYTGVPPLAQVIVSLSAGLACDFLVSKVGIPALRMQIRLQQFAVGVPMLSLLALSQLENSPLAACILVTLWLGCTSFQSAGAMAVLHSVGGPRAGEIFVLGNAFAKLGTLLAASCTRWLLHTLGWKSILIGLAAAYALSGMLLLPNMKHVERAAAVVAGDKASQKKTD